MTFAEGILSELAEADAFARWRNAAASIDLQAELAGTDLRMLALVRAENLQVAPVTSVVTSLVNAIESGLFPQIPVASIKLFVPIYSPAFIAAVEKLSQHPDLLRTSQLWQALSGALSLAQRLTATVGLQANTLEREDICDVEIIADAWRRVCTASEALHEDIATMMACAGQLCDQTAEAGPLRLLKLASLGGWPCLDRTGHITIPGVAERRAEARHIVDRPVEVSTDSGSFAAVLSNATAIGLGLEAAVALQAGTEVTVWISEECGLVGVVRWCKGGRIGVRLLEPLLPDDPLFADR